MNVKSYENKIKNEKEIWQQYLDWCKANGEANDYERIAVIKALFKKGDK